MKVILDSRRRTTRGSNVSQVQRSDQSGVCAEGGEAGGGSSNWVKAVNLVREMSRIGLAHRAETEHAAVSALRTGVYEYEGCWCCVDYKSGCPSHDISLCVHLPVMFLLEGLCASIGSLANGSGNSFSPIGSVLREEWRGLRGFA